MTKKNELSDKEKSVNNNNEKETQQTDSSKKINFEELSKKLDKENKKFIKFPELTTELKSKIEHVSKELTTLKKETAEKKEVISNQMNLVDKKINQLVKDKKIKINGKERKQSEDNIKHYIMLLKGVIQEIEHELSYFSQFSAKDKPSLVVVHKDAPENFGLYIEEKVKWSKRYTKNIRKSTTVSFSRYKFSFEEQLKKLNYMQNFLSPEQDEK
jgi:hypothetical protein